MFHIHRIALVGYEKLVKRLGANPISLLAQVGISQVQLRESNVYLSLTAVTELLELTAQSCNEPLFGVKLASEQGFRMLGELGMSTSQQATVLAALDYIETHRNLFILGVRIERFQHDNMTEMKVVFDFDSNTGVKQITQLQVIKTFQLIQYLTQTNDPQLRIQLQQPQPSGLKWREKGIANRLNFNSDYDGVCFPSSWLKKQPQRDSDALQSLLMDRVQQLQSKYPKDLETRITSTIINLLSSGECTINQVANALEIHPRSLQQKLQRKGLSFSQLLQQTRLHIAKQNLQHSEQSITELAFTLGYADIAVFSRNFKKWTGFTPTQFRDKE